jgi:hypothetical protein
LKRWFASEITWVQKYSWEWFSQPEMHKLVDNDVFYKLEIIAFGFVRVPTCTVMSINATYYWRLTGTQTNDPEGLRRPCASHAMHLVAFI